MRKQPSQPATDSGQAIGKAKEEPTGKIACLWADDYLVLIQGESHLWIQGDPFKTVATFAGKLACNAQLEIHYQGRDLLLLPPMREDGSLSSWLNRHLPPGTGLDAYLLAFTGTGNRGPLALLPKEHLQNLFSVARNAGFFGVRLWVMPKGIKQSCTLWLANGLWKVTLDQAGGFAFLPLPLQSEGQCPAMLTPTRPMLDFRFRPFDEGLFCWEDDSAKIIQIQQANRRMLVRLGLAVSLICGLLWGGLAWRAEHLEGQLVQQKVAQKSETQASRRFEERRAHLDELNQALTKHPYARKSATHAGQLRVILNASPAEVVLSRIQIQAEPDQKVGFLEGFSPDTSQPLVYIKNLKGFFPDREIDLMQLDSLPEKQRQTDKRLGQQATWFRFTIRLERL